MSKTTTGAARYLFAACEAKTGDALAKLVLISPANRADNNGECYPSLARIADDCETTERSVIRKLEVLESKGFLIRIRRSEDGMKTSNLYRFPDVTHGYHVMTERHHDVTQSHGGSDTVSPRVVTECHIKHPLETPKETERSNQFDDWYQTYPKKQGKKQAKKAFMNLNSQALITCLADNLKARYKNTERQFIPLPATYLNGERWDDELDTKPSIEDRYL